MMAFDMLPAHTQQSATAAARTQRGAAGGSSGRRAGIISGIVAAFALVALGFGSAAMADSAPELTAPQHEQLHHARTGCLTPECPTNPAP